jgi:Zn-dependent M28 family amino/carboxypeptidase
MTKNPARWFPLHAALAFSPGQMKKELNSFVASGRPQRGVGSEGHDKAYAYLKQQVTELAQKHNGKVYEHGFYPDVDFAIQNYRDDFDSKVEGKVKNGSPDYEKWKAFTGQAISFVEAYRNKRGKNLVLEFKGKKRPKEVLYIGAHYDTISHNHKTMEFTPNAPTDGADDNGSGVALVLAIARELAKSSHDRTLRIVFFDYEEIFFLGSYAMAKDLAAKQISWAERDETFGGLYNFEMVGWSKKKLKARPVVKLYTRSGKTAEAASDAVLAQMFIQSAKTSKARLKPVLLANDFDRSDNWSFWQKRFSAVCVSQDWEKDFNKKHYHTATDTPATLNYDYLAEITRVAAAAVSASLRSD